VVSLIVSCLPAQNGRMPSRTSLVLTIWVFNAHLAKYLGL
jgi:hypothetical protein